MNFYLLASSVCISEQSWELSHWSICAYIWRKNYAVSLSSLGTWLTLLGMWHFSQCQSEWLAREFISFFTISLSLSQFLTEFSLLSQLSLAPVGATWLPSAPDCMSWHRRESGQRLSINNLRSVSRCCPLPDSWPGRHSACGRAPPTAPARCSPRRTPRVSSRLKCQNIYYFLRWQEKVFDTDEV